MFTLTASSLTSFLPAARTFLAATLLAGGLSLGSGCVNQGNYDALLEANLALQSRNSELMEEKRRLEAEIAALTGRMSMSDSAVGLAGKTTEQLRLELLAAQARLADLERRLGDLNIGGPLDAATDAALEDLARRYPDILDYDRERGMLRFKSDVTFASGSFELTPQARQTIRDLGRILQEVPSASQYDIRVVGHTDGQRVSQRPGRPFTNNVELSAFRAISSFNEMPRARRGHPTCPPARGLPTRVPAHAAARRRVGDRGSRTSALPRLRQCRSAQDLRRPRPGVARLRHEPELSGLDLQPAVA